MAQLKAPLWGHLLAPELPMASAEAGPGHMAAQLLSPPAPASFPFVLHGLISRALLSSTVLHFELHLRVGFLDLLDPTCHDSDFSGYIPILQVLPSPPSLDSKLGPATPSPNTMFNQHLP